MVKEITNLTMTDLSERLEKSKKLFNDATRYIFDVIHPAVNEMLQIIKSDFSPHKITDLNLEKIGNTLTLRFGNRPAAAKGVVNGPTMVITPSVSGDIVIYYDTSWFEVSRVVTDPQTKRFTVDAPHIDEVTLKTICDFIAEVEYKYQEGIILQGA
jgi:hypothetical protein